MSKYLIILLLLYSIPGCKDNTLDPIVLYTGSWHFVFNSDSSVYGNSDIIISDNGSFCGDFKVNSTSEIYSFEGNVSSSGNVTGKFSSSCGINLKGSVTGNIADVGGITSGSGIWTDSTRSFFSNCTWVSRRN